MKDKTVNGYQWRMPNMPKMKLPRFGGQGDNNEQMPANDEWYGSAPLTSRQINDAAENAVREMQQDYDDFDDAPSPETKRGGRFSRSSRRTGGEEAQPQEKKSGGAFAGLVSGLQGLKQQVTDAFASSDEMGYEQESSSGNAEQPRRRTAGDVAEGRLEVTPERRQQYADASSLKKKQPEARAYTPSLGASLVKEGYNANNRYKRRNRRPMKMWLKATLTVTCIVLVFSLIIVGTFMGLIKGRVNYVADRRHNTVRLSIAEQEKLYAEETEILEDAAAFTQPDLIYEPDKDVQLILVVAADNRLGTERSAVCDALMLCAIDYKNNDVKLVSIMRDLYVRIPGYYSNCISKAFYYDTALGDYSMPTLMATVQQNLGVTPDAYVVVDFDAIQKMVNSVGGIKMTLTDEEALYMSTDSKYGLFPRFTRGGEYLMSGAEALNYIRMYKVGNGEFDRSVRQRKVMLELLRSLGEMSFTEMAVFTYAMLPELPTSLSEKDVWKLFTHAKEIAKLAGTGEDAKDGRVEQIKVYEQIIPVVGTWREGRATVLDETFPVVVTNLTFSASTIQDFIYDDDKTYLSGQIAEDVQIPDVAPMPVVEEPEETQEEE